MTVSDPVVGPLVRSADWERIRGLSLARVSNMQSVRTGEVFLSYAHEDRAYTHALADFLWEHGLPVWLDDEIVRGERFPPQLTERIRESAAFVVVMSKSSQESKWVGREVEIALENSGM